MSALGVGVRCVADGADQRQAWDVLRIEYWGEGRVVFYPADSSLDRRIDEVTFDVTFADLREREATYDAMGDEDGIR